MRKIIQYSKSLRFNQTKYENILWEYLQSKKIKGYKFRRQHIIGDFIVDFVCIKRKLIIEVDGVHHFSQIEEHYLRTIFLESKGYKVLRFTNYDIKTRLNYVLHIISQEINIPKKS